MNEDQCVALVSFADATPEARRYTRWRIVQSLQRKIPARDRYVQAIAAEVFTAALCDYGDVRMLVDSETGTIVVAIAAAVDELLLCALVRDKYRGFGLGDRLLEAIRKDHPHMRALRDPHDTSTPLSPGDVRQLYAWHERVTTLGGSNGNSE